jgi:hypothetical protein
VGFVVNEVVLGQVSPANSHSTDSLFIIQGWYNRPVNGRRTKVTQSHPTPRKLKKPTTLYIRRRLPSFWEGSASTLPKTVKTALKTLKIPFIAFFKRTRHWSLCRVISNKLKLSQPLLLMFCPDIVFLSVSLSPLSYYLSSLYLVQ